MNTSTWKFQLGDPVKKISGSDWEGKVCGFYTTEQTEHGYCIESKYHKNTWQGYPEKALELIV